MPKTISLLTLLLVTAVVSLDADARGPTKLAAELGGEGEVIDTPVNGATLPVQGLVTAASGKARFTLSPDRSTLSYTLMVSDTATPIFMAHIHLGPAGRNGPVILWLFGDSASSPNPGNPLPREDGPFTGQISGTLTAANLVPQPGLGLVDFEDAVTNILRGNAYVNVHTVAHPPGEVRGQIKNLWGSWFGF